MSTFRQTSEKLHINEIIPYWRNPRVIPEEAVNAVAESIKRYGYQQPIVVDKDNVIIIGHTRYAALRRLKAEEVLVKVADLDGERANQLRVLDNRTSELSEWDFDTLIAELDDLDGELMSSYFPEAEYVPDEGPDHEFAIPADTSAWDEVNTDADFVCPACFHEFSITVTPEAVQSGKLKVQK